MLIVLPIYAPCLTLLTVCCVLQVMEHPHTLLLGKVLQSNIALGNAHVNSAERSKIISRWMDLQQSINVLYDSKTGTGSFTFLVFIFCGYLHFSMTKLTDLSFIMYNFPTSIKV